MCMPKKYKKRPRIILNSRSEDFEGKKRNLDDLRNMMMLNRYSAANQKYEQENFLEN